jgi:transposase
MPAGDRVRERRKPAALARHYRDEEGLSIAEIARRLGRAEATVKAYLCDPTGEKARAGQGSVRRGVPGLRRLYPVAQRQGRRLRFLQGLPPRSDPAPGPVSA